MPRALAVNRQGDLPMTGDCGAPWACGFGGAARRSRQGGFRFFVQAIPVVIGLETQLRSGMTGKKSNVLFWTLAVTALALTLLLAGLSASHFFRPPASPDEGNAHWRKAQEAIAAREFPEAAARLSICLE